MTQGERLKEVRKTLGLTLEKFGSRLGVGKTAISKLERNENNITDQMSKAICREFSVDYIWFTTGEGEMFLQKDLECILFHKHLLNYVSQMNAEEVKALEYLVSSFQRFSENENKEKADI